VRLELAAAHAFGRTEASGLQGTEAAFLHEGEKSVDWLQNRTGAFGAEGQRAPMERFLTVLRRPWLLEGDRQKGLVVADQGFRDADCGSVNALPS
jgi:hypothetical protein